MKGPLYNAKDILERLGAMNNKAMSPNAALSEIQELIERAHLGAEECYQAEIDMDKLRGRTVRIAWPGRSRRSS